ncbi:polysaccharide lyase 8 family protein [Streptomyces sp. B22F1]|uniref:polysaccharide lyase 8 family protein n=1 Tax=Streptomyces sp. B22F1 TaxID=3153566 RepID=UPI00325E726D
MRPVRPPLPSRRTLLAASAGTLLVPASATAAYAAAPGAAPGPPTAPAAPAAAPADEEALLERAARMLAGDGYDPADPDFAAALAGLEAETRRWWDTLDRSAGRTALWPDLAPVADAGNFGQCYPRLRTLAIAWTSPGTSFTGRADVAAALVDALRFLHDAAYHPARTPTGNWWFWEIGAPRALLDCCVLLRAALPAADLAAYLATVDRFVPDPDRRTGAPTLSETGANRADKCVIVALRGLLGRSPEKTALARDGLSDVRDGGRNSLFQYVTSGDGFYRDGSFIQHGSVAYTGTYGAVLLAAAGQLMALLAGSPWAVTDPATTVLFDAVERSFAPVITDGLMMDAVRGRAISRERAPDHVDGALAVSYVLQLAEAAPAEQAARWHAAAKGWIERQSAYPYLSLVGLPHVQRAKAVLADPAVPAAPPLTGHHCFAAMERVVHRRPGWSYALSLSSKRVAAYEAGNGENRHGWYTGDGMGYLYLPGDQGQFGDAFWPTVNAYRLPGTTVDTRPRAGLGTVWTEFRPANEVSGGAVLHGRYGAAAFELRADGSSLRARKTWFFLDDAVVALGADIAAGDGRVIETTVENRALRGDGAPAFVVDGRRQPEEPGRERGFDGARWAHLEGVGGYVFLDADGGSRLRALREDRTGAWRDINTGADTGGSTTPHTRRYLTLWLDHGTSPAGARYAYALLPTASRVATAAWSASGPVRVAANDAAAQAVEIRHLGLTAAHFWTAATAAGIRSEGPATVLLRHRDDTISLAVSDPGHTAAEIRLELPLPVRAVTSADPTVEVTPGRRGRVTVRTEGSRGATHRAELR